MEEPSGRPPLKPELGYNSLSNFHIEKKIGRGQFSEVYKAVCLLDNTPTALKKVKVNEIFMNFGRPIKYFSTLFHFKCSILSTTVPASYITIVNRPITEISPLMKSAGTKNMD